MPALKQPSRAQIVLAFAAMYLVGGSVFLGQRVAMHGGLTAFLTSGARMALAGAILLAWSCARGGGIAPRRTWLDLAISGSLLFVGGSALSMIASDRIPSGLVALLTASVPFWIALGAAALPGGERPSGLGAFGLGLGFAGLAIVIVPTVHGDASASGIVIAVISAVAWAAGSLWARHRLRALPAMTIASHQMLFGALPLLAIGLSRGELGQLAPTGDALLALGYLIIFGNLITYQAFVFLMNHVAPAKVSTYAYINPILAISLGAWLAGERLPAHGVLGAIAILAGVALTNLAPRGRRAR
ncbi:MAG TPA: EamA family transporter [Kofleriaceae bacterium]|nr:EamA family transporter [Kofleriaceae bacterium]